MPGGEQSGVERNVLFAIRYVLPAVVFLAGWVILFTVDGSLRWEGCAMCMGAAGSILAFNALVRFGTTGDLERDKEHAARDYLREHGHWPDEEPPK